ncbi:hypothetical protein Tco_0123494 [Tanacetum coccineum]
MRISGGYVYDLVPLVMNQFTYDYLRLKRLRSSLHLNMRFLLQLFLTATVYWPGKTSYKLQCQTYAGSGVQHIHEGSVSGDSSINNLDCSKKRHNIQFVTTEISNEKERGEEREERDGKKKEEEYEGRKNTKGRNKKKDKKKEGNGERRRMKRNIALNLILLSFSNNMKVGEYHEKFVFFHASMISLYAYIELSDVSLYKVASNKDQAQEGVMFHLQPKSQHRSCGAVLVSLGRLLQNIGCDISGPVSPKLYDVKGAVLRARANPEALLKGFEVCLAAQVQPPIDT